MQAKAEKGATEPPVLWYGGWEALWTSSRMWLWDRVGEETQVPRFQGCCGRLQPYSLN